MRERDRAFALGALARLPPAAGRERAFVVDQSENVYYAETAAPRQGSPDTPATELIEGAFSELKDQTFFVLRRTIFATYELTPACRGMIKVGAKRSAPLGAGSPAEPKSIIRLASAPPLDEWFDPSIAVARAWPEPSRPIEPMKLARRLADAIERGTTLHRYARGVAAVLTDADGRLLRWAVNTNAPIKTQHAERNLARASGTPIPRGAAVHVTHKPCRMCAGALWQAAEDPAALKVFYKIDDPGARGTVLDEGSAERLRAARDDRERRARILDFKC